MRLQKLFGARPNKMPMWAALCTGRADGSNPKYVAGVKHAILAMVLAVRPEVEHSVYALLQSNGWREPDIENMKLLDEPFHSDDPVMRACYDSAVKQDGDFVVYSDPIYDA